jgi:hypothetical protein
LSHGWLKVEEGKNEKALPSEEKRDGKSKKSERDSRGPCSPFYKTRGAGYIGEERKRERGCACNTGVLGGGDFLLLQRVLLSLFAAAVACGCLSSCHPFTRMWQEQ